MLVFMATDDKFVLKIYTDDTPLDPRRDFENLGTMVCGHRRYRLGDQEAENVESYNNWLDWLHGEVGSDRDILYLPLYLLDHSILTMRTVDFHDPWDSGQVGWIYVTKEKIRKEFGVKRISRALREKVLDILRAEVELYDHYLQGNVYGFVLETKDGEEIDSCWGFYGDDFKSNGLACHLEEPYQDLVDSLKLVS